MAQIIFLYVFACSDSVAVLKHVMIRRFLFIEEKYIIPETCHETQLFNDYIKGMSYSTSIPFVLIVDLDQE